MRLTLRTLLAYLDDTLEPAEAKLIGQKVAESDTAKELIARIKEVTRRRRITTPVTNEKDKTGPTENDIAEYLDNELTPERLAELEQLALASDVHLAEIAACHQILTVVLGEPAVVPPTAFRRMYGLRKSPESNPQHRPPVRKEVEEGVPQSKEVDETLRLGLPALHRGSLANGLILAGGAVFVLLLLAVAIWMVLPPFGREAEPRVEVTATGKTLLPGPVIDKDKKDKATAKTPADTGANKETTAKEITPKIDDKTPPKEKIPEPKSKHLEDEGPTPPDPTVRDVGQFEPVKSDPAVLLQKKKRDSNLWTRLLRTNDPATSRVLSNMPLLSLPGYRSIVKLDSGAQLTLWGNVPEIWPFPVAFESLVMLHPSTEFDVDLTLSRGRLALVNGRDKPLKFRLRFANPANAKKDMVWDITLLEKGTEIIVSLWGVLIPGEAFSPKKDQTARSGPVAAVWAVVKSGKAELKYDLQPVHKLVPPPDGPIVAWESFRGALEFLPVKGIPTWVQAVPAVPEGLKFDTKARKAVIDALDSLSFDLSGPNVDTGLVAAMKTGDPQKRRLVIRSAGAMDDLQRVLEALGDKEGEVRQVAIESLRVWISAAKDNDQKLFEELQPKLSATDAEIFMTLLLPFRPEQDADPALQDLLVKYLKHNKIEIRELSYDHLIRMFPAGRSIGYNSTAPLAQVNDAAAQWQALVQKNRRQGGK